MPAVVEELSEDHATAAPTTINGALTIHVILLDQWFSFIQTNPCHDFVTGMLNFFEGPHDSSKAF
jgi:hypothetical protein